MRLREFRVELKKNDHVIAELRNHCYFHLQNICKKGQNCRITIVQWLESGIDYQSATSNDYHFSGGKIISSAQSMSVYYRDLKVDFSNKTFLCSIIKYIFVSGRDVFINENFRIKHVPNESLESSSNYGSSSNVLFVSYHEYGNLSQSLLFYDS